MEKERRGAKMHQFISHFFQSQNESFALFNSNCVCASLKLSHGMKKDLQKAIVEGNFLKKNGEKIIILSEANKLQFSN